MKNEDHRHDEEKNSVVIKIFIFLSALSLHNLTLLLAQ